MLIHSPKPEPAIVRDQLQALQALYKAWGMCQLCASLIWILAKTDDANKQIKGRLVPFVWNLVQRDLYPKLGAQNRILKDRQGGYTTLMLLARLFLPILIEPGTNGLLISQSSKKAAEHFQMVRRAYRHFAVANPEIDEANVVSRSLKANLLHLQYSNRHELVFDMIDSRLVVESAEVTEAAQGITLHHVVSSETARWPHDPSETTSNVKGALVKGGTYDEESTANGMGGYFAERFLESIDNPAMADAVPHYYSWYFSEDYFLALTEKEKDELEKDLTADEYALIRKMQRELSAVTA